MKLCWNVSLCICTAQLCVLALTGTYGSEVMSVQAVRKWCHQFKNGRISVLDKERTGRSLSVSTDELWNRKITTSACHCLLPSLELFLVLFNPSHTFHSNEEVQKAVTEWVNNVGSEIWFHAIYNLIH